MLAVLSAKSLAFVHVSVFAFDVSCNTPVLPFSPDKILHHFLLLPKAVKTALFHDQSAFVQELLSVLN